MTKHLVFGRPIGRSWAFLLLAGLTAGSAWAQWQWKDAGGRRVFSDTPPPPSIPERDILKRPGQRAGSETTAPGSTPSAGVPVSASTSAAPGAPASPAAARPTDAEADPVLDAKKQQLEKAEAEKALAEKKAIEAKNAKIRADNCESARRSLAALDSGVRMTTQNAQGETEYLDEAGRAAQQRRMQALVRENCR